MNKTGKVSKQKTGKSKQKVLKKPAPKPKPFHILKQLKLSLQKLLSHSQFDASCQGEYLRHLADIQAFLSNGSVLGVSSESIFYIVSVEKQLKHLLNLFCSLTAHKQVVIGILGQIYKRVFDTALTFVIQRVKSSRGIHSINQGKNSINTNLNSQFDHKKYIQIHSFMEFLQKQLFQAIEFILIVETGIDGYSETQHLQNLIIQLNQKDQQQSEFISKVLKTSICLLRKYHWVELMLKKQTQILAQKVEKDRKTFDTKMEVNHSSLLLTFISLLNFSQTIIRNSLVFCQYPKH